ncbi:MAG TPA: tetratricopeptide repeat protein [Candidatus Angelobacter sp.]|nr:tetratricopeptide repeat protein [Candidatus Angelobacter sp.]
MLLVALVFTQMGVFAQDTATAQQLFTQERWTELVGRLSTIRNRSAEQEYEYGVALARLKRWKDAHSALLRGSRLAPGDKRFPIELAGVAFSVKHQEQAAGYLKRALRLDAHDDYANDFLATIYFLQGNLEAAVKYWNRLSHPRPQVDELRNDPPLRIRPALLDHAFAYAPASVLRLSQLRATTAQVQNLQIYPNYRLDLVAHPDGRFDSVFRATELDGFGSGKMGALLRTFSGLPFQEVRPEYYNMAGTATNILTIARWDPDKRRCGAEFSAPLGEDPQWRYRIDVGVRNENWEIRHGFTGLAPIEASLNLRREEAGAEISRLIGWRSQWFLGVDFSHRDFRNVVPGAALTQELLEHGFELKQIARLRYEILRSPEHRLNISSDVNSQAGRLWSQPGESFEKLQVSIEGHWFPEASGGDLETRWRTSTGSTFGQLPFDELFMLGLERDNDPALWMRAHIGTRHGRKGSAPLGRNYFIANWDTDKNLYSNGLLTLKLGPFIDTGKITDPVSALGSQEWLVDTGAEMKIRVLGVGAAFTYGKDLRTGNNAFYVTLAR